MSTGAKHWRLAERGAEPQDKFRQQTPVDLAEHGGYWVIGDPERETVRGLRAGPWPIYEDAAREANQTGGRVVTAGWLKRQEQAMGVLS
jgi:hypothetical protein